MFELNFISSKEVSDFDGKAVQVNIIVDEDKKYGTSLTTKSVMDIESIYSNTHTHFRINEIYDTLTNLLNKISKSDELAEQDWKDLTTAFKAIYEEDLSVFVDALLFARLNMEVVDVDNKKDMIQKFAEMVKLELSLDGTKQETPTLPDTDGANAVTYVNGAPLEDDDYEDPDQVHMGYSDEDSYYDTEDGHIFKT